MILADPALEGVGGGSVRRVPRALARRRSRPRAGARRAAGPARGSATSGHVGDARRRAGARAPRRRAADRKQRPRLPRRDALCRPDPKRAYRRRGRARHARRVQRAKAARSSSSCRGRAKSAASPRSLRRGSGRRRSTSRRSTARWTARAQDLAIAPAWPGRRKIVLATSIAETSLTIEGVRVVVDCGLMRVPRLRARCRPDAARDGARQQSQRRPASRARGPRRAGRLLSPVGRGGERRPSALCRAGDPLRRSLGTSRSTAPPGASPIRRKLAFLDPPPRGALTEARALLTAIGALDGEGRITDEGRAISSLALPPRLARMVVDAARAGDARTASEVAVLLTERGLGGDAVDLTIRLEAFRRDRSQRAGRREAAGEEPCAKSGSEPSPPGRRWPAQPAG